MVVYRSVLNCKWGCGDEVLSLSKKMFSSLAGGAMRDYRLLTDLTGPYFKIVLDATFEDLGAWQKWRSEVFRTSDFAELASRMADLVDSGTAEFFTLEAAG